MPRKPSDLADNVHSIGGAMSKWPLRTVTWACRENRVGIADPNVIETMLEVDAEDLDALENRADKLGIGTGELYEKRHALEWADPETLLGILDREYRSEFGPDTGEWSGSMHKCPFEESGLDKACWRCPVPGSAMDTLREERDGGE